MGMSLWIRYHYETQLFYKAVEVPITKAGLVLGASVKRNSIPSEVLRQRLEAANALYQSGRIQKLILSGDNTRPYYDEVNVMKKYMLKKGIPPKDIFLDHNGIRTFDSLYRARHKFGCQKLVIISQAFHLPRALFIASHLGIKAYGFSADSSVESKDKFLMLRENFARGLAILDIYVYKRNPPPVGDPVDLDQDGRITWN